VIGLPRSWLPRGHLAGHDHSQPIENGDHVAVDRLEPAARRPPGSLPRGPSWSSAPAPWCSPPRAPPSTCSGSRPTSRRPSRRGDTRSMHLPAPSGVRSSQGTRSRTARPLRDVSLDCDVSAGCQRRILRGDSWCRQEVRAIRIRYWAPHLTGQAFARSAVEDASSGAKRVARQAFPS